MHILLTKSFAKILVLPAIFSFALACCQPLFVQAAQANAGHLEISREKSALPAVHELMVQEGHQCDHGEHHEQSALQVPTQKIVVDFTAYNLASSGITSHQYSALDSPVIALPRITGPPWDGKSIKAFLGVYRS